MNNAKGPLIKLCQWRWWGAAWVKTHAFEQVFGTIEIETGLTMVSTWVWPWLGWVGLSIRGVNGVGLKQYSITTRAARGRATDSWIAAPLAVTVRSNLGFYDSKMLHRYFHISFWVYLTSEKFHLSPSSSQIS